jgi:hypothetical protein
MVWYLSAEIWFWQREHSRKSITGMVLG